MTQQAPLVSIAMCTYNGARYLRRQLDTLLGQDYPNLEIVITDDVSTDETREILEQYAARDPKIKLHHNENNLGFIKNFERAISLCNGEFIALCDQDDIWLPHKISTLVSSIGDHSLAYSQVRVVDQDEKPLNIRYPSRKQLEGRCHMALLLTNFVIGHTMLFRADLRDKIIPVPDSCPHDQWIAFVAASTGPGLKRLDEALSLYRFHDSNLIGGTKRRLSGKEKKTRHRELSKQLSWFTKMGNLPAEDRQVVDSITKSLHNSPNRFFNVPLFRILLTNKKRVLAAHRRPFHAIFRLCKNAWKNNDRPY